MSDNSSNFVRDGYYYQPLKNDGPFETHLETAGGIIGKALAQAAAAEEPWGEIPEASEISNQIGEHAGGMVGKAAGFYMDNASTIIKNANTMIEQLNDPRMWMDAASQGMIDR